MKRSYTTCVPRCAASDERRRPLRLRAVRRTASNLLRGGLRVSFSAVNAPSPLRVFRTCGTALASLANGIGPLCPACLLDFALGEEPAAEELASKGAPERSSGGTSVPVEGQFAHYMLV